MIAYRYDPNVHFIPRDFEAIKHLRRRLRHPLVVLIQHRKSGNWAISLWREDRPGCVEDLAFIGGCEEGPVANYLTAEVVSKADYILNGPPQSWDALKYADRDRAVAEMENDAEELRVRKFLARKTGVDDPLIGR